ncbi:alpha-L-arabinofuranosidase C-terminal domain-containing protein [Fontisphaera persica]|uniref:alpha-L-arabinofuranosidase C-terminal domain-containing protein n=1 Tax=Fontisphaera persica TaxID=2974023 RepID=UPI0024BF4344|nr:alpha-L-arabinofuranosidase C-terminal domain-containing protein [Fontisphaera persica]WCJ58523.1 alpha-L-arabinofuranosidase C-terminal domain-containing protein [Fontisphaera persica]
MKVIARLLLVAGLAIPCVFSQAAEEAACRIEIDVHRPVARVSPVMWGIFFEDINFGADGGLYGELVKNRSFEFNQPLMGWQVSRPPGSAAMVGISSRDALHPNNPQYLDVTLGPADKGVAIINEGFRGMGIRQGETYDFSVFARQVTGGPVTLILELLDAQGLVIGRAQIKGLQATWQRHTASLTARATEAKARLRLTFEGQGRLHLDMVSLFPRKTWKNRPGGLRADMVQMLAELKPAFIRFPGGCIVEGFNLENRYQWKNTIGRPEERKLIINRWNMEFKHRPTPDYYQSFGLGFYEYFLLCEDLGAEPLPILNCGMACQFNTGELVPLEQLDPFIQDALDLIEFANGPTNTVWGAKRAAMGHPRPFHLKMLGIGNEQWGPQYLERYERFARVLQQRHPEIRLISSAGPDPDGPKFDFLWPRLRQLRADIVDEHYYRPPQWFLDNTRRYDRYDRNGPRVFAGEYAAQSVRTVSPDNRNNWECALAEAAFMTGLERNGEVVRMCSYAPLSAHEEAWQWRPNLIWFDNLRVYGTPNYYVQQAFARNRGDLILPARLSGDIGQPERVYASATFEESTREVILKIVNATAAPRMVNLQFNGAVPAGRAGRATVLAAALAEENSLTHPTRVAPLTQSLTPVGPAVAHVAPAYSLSVLRVPVKISAK